MTTQRALWIALAALLSVVGACNGRTSSSGGGSETNWVVCETDAECSGSECLCGHCGTACSESEPCPGDPTKVQCATLGTAVFSALCAESQDATSGVCVSRCAIDADCPSGFECRGDACVPRRFEARDVGAACVPSDELNPSAAGAATTEVNIESHTSQCATELCLSYYFQGRVSCPYGQTSGSGGCTTPSGEPVTVSVEPQLSKRRPSDAVFCSCRCAGEGPGPYCACPDSFVCAPVIPNLRLSLPGEDNLAGSYCVRVAIEDPRSLASDAGPVCSLARLDCGPP